MGELPNLWAYARLPDLIAGDGVFVDGDWIESKDQDPSGDVRLIQLADVGDGVYINKSNRFLTSGRAVELNCTFLRSGDVLIARMPDPLGRACIFPGDKKKAVTVVDVCVVRARKDHVDSVWLKHFINAPTFRSEIDSLQSGSTRKRISRGNLSTLNLPVPPRAEQTRIVDKLEELLSDLDAGVAELKAAQKKLAQYRQSLLKAAVEGRLTEAWRAQRGQTADSEENGAQLLTRILRERRARWETKQLAKFEAQGKAPPKGWQDSYLESVTANEAELPALPQGWVWETVDSLISEIETGKSFKCEERPPRANEIGVAKVSAVSWGEYNEQESKTCRDAEKVNPALFVQAGDFLFSRANTIELVGACVIAQQISMRVMLSDKTLRFVFVVEQLKHWLLFFLRSEFGRLQIELLSSGNQESMRNIGQERIRQIAVPLPPPAELDEAIDNLVAALEGATTQDRAITASLHRITAQRKNILQTAFSGQLVPQDPNDEPASLLLARLRAERASQPVKLRKPRASRGLA